MAHTDWKAPPDWHVPEGWIDSSYGNDTCPSWTDETTGRIIFVEYPKGQRECAGVSQYTVYAEYGTDSHLFETDSFDTLSAYLSA
jgi:hypothetical protein